MSCHKTVIISTTTKKPALTISPSKRSPTALGAVHLVEPRHLDEPMTVIIICHTQTGCSLLSPVLILTLLDHFQILMRHASVPFSFSNRLEKDESFVSYLLDAVRCLIMENYCVFG